MNIKMKRIVYLLIVLMVTLSFSNFKVVEAATVELNVPSSVTEGDTITASISGKAEQWNLTLKANGTTIASTNNLTNEGSEISISKSGTYKTTEAGNVTFTLTGDYSYTSNGEVVVVDVNTSRTVTVNKITPPPSEEPEEPDTPSEPETPTTPEEPTTPSEPEKPTTPEEPEKPSEPEKPAVVEPNFTASNRIMYATGDINLRASWSTSSEATRIEKDTELTVTATSTNTVNGYVWYRVSYNGQTKYVAAYLLTDVKPEEEEKKSDNAFLKSLTVEGQEILPTFDKEVTSYSDIHIGELYENYPIFDSYDLGDDRTYQNYIFRKNEITKQDMETAFTVYYKGNFCMVHEQIPEDLLPILYYSGEGKYMLLASAKV